MADKHLINKPVVGDDFSIRRSITADGGAGVPQPIVRAWLTIKTRRSDDDDDAIVQKVVTGTYTPFVGEIEEAGDEDTPAVVRFDIVPEESEAIGTKLRYYDIQVELDDGKIATPQWQGRIKLNPQTTLSR